MTDEAHTIEVLIVDDQALVCAGFSRIVNAQPDMRTVGVAADGVEAIELVKELHPDVILMDIRMPKMNGIDAALTLTRERISPSTKILGLTTYDSDDYAIRMLRAGAIGFILKDCTAAQLVDAIRSVNGGTFATAASTTQRLLEKISVDHQQSAAADLSMLDVLTDRERIVFDLVIKGLSNPEIARDLFIADVTVKTHVGHILTKLGVRDRIQLVIWAHREGCAGPSSGADLRPSDDSLSR